MKFPGYWLCTVDDTLSVCTAEFDDTDLSPASGWKEAWGNAEEALPHGFVDPVAMLLAVSTRVLQGEDPEATASVMTRFRAGETVPIKSLEDLARLVQVTLSGRQ
jgi:hypothetical protein